MCCVSVEFVFQAQLLQLLRNFGFLVLLRNTVLCCALLCCAVLCCAVLCCAVLCCVVLCCVVLCCAVLCCCYTALCHAVPCRAMPCRAETRNTRRSRIFSALYLQPTITVYSLRDQNRLIGKSVIVQYSRDYTISNTR